MTTAGNLTAAAYFNYQWRLELEFAPHTMTGLKWTRRTTARIAAELRVLGIEVCPRTVARLLGTMGFALRVNHKKRAGASHPDRDAQFQHIAGLRRRCAAENLPIVSVDTKKKELVGNFKNPGAKWDRTPQLVRDHDFRSEAQGIAIPYGVYDPQANAGAVFVGSSFDTPAFAVDCIEKWWRTEGRRRYPGASQLHILADSGGSNSCTSRAWKYHLQHRLCAPHRLTVTVAHYPTATSKWNPIEHRLFCEISKKLGRTAAHRLPNRPQIPAHHNHPHRPARMRASRPARLQEGRQDQRRPDAQAQPHETARHAQVELHPFPIVTNQVVFFAPTLSDEPIENKPASSAMRKRGVDHLQLLRRRFAPPSGGARCRCPMAELPIS